ncbi:MAG: hypothetical protein EOO75_10535 [Myxococcales bacterium]|nr:MAG: hypothetical protein EOO75_10535 [Myxococcales bacterium]
MTMGVTASTRPWSRPSVARAPRRTEGGRRGTPDDARRRQTTPDDATRRSRAATRPNRDRHPASGRGTRWGMGHTVVLSDIHLCELEREEGLWMRYRQKAYGPDQELVAMLEALRREASGDSLTLVFNGDTFDLDAPRVLDGRSVFHDLPRSAEHAVPMLGAILDDHAEVVAAVGGVLADGHSVVFVSGNHDIQLTLPAVRARLVERLVAAARAAGARGTDATLAARVAFRAWFHRTPEGIHIEHGHQYDDYCSYRYPMAPFGPDADTIQPTVGSLTSRHLTARMGFFNPHVEATFMLSAAGYASHWVERYARSEHSIVVPWVVGAVRTMSELLRTRRPFDPARLAADLRAASAETGVAEDTLRAHAALFEPPAAEARLERVVRELWLDRLSLGLLSAGTITAGLLTHNPWLAAVGPALFAAYELLSAKPPLDDTWSHVARRARDVARVQGAPAVVFGHTHHGESTWEDGVYFGNCGSWSAAFHDLECTRPLEPSKPLIWLRHGEGRPIAGGMVRWGEGGFVDG